MPAHILGDAGRFKSLAPTPVVVDPHDPPVAQREDVEDLAQRLFLGADVRSACAQHDLLSGARFLWQGNRNFISLDPGYSPAHIFRISRRVRTERDFDYFL